MHRDQNQGRYWDRGNQRYRPRGHLIQLLLLLGAGLDLLPLLLLRERDEEGIVFVLDAVVVELVRFHLLRCGGHAPDELIRLLADSTEFVTNAPLVHLQRFVPPLRVVQQHPVCERDLATQFRPGVHLLHQDDVLEEPDSLLEVTLAQRSLCILQSHVPPALGPLVDVDALLLSILVELVLHALTPLGDLLLGLLLAAHRDLTPAAELLADVVGALEHPPGAHLGLIRLLGAVRVLGLPAHHLPDDVVGELRALLLERAHAAVVVHAETALASAAGREHALLLVGWREIVIAAPSAGVWLVDRLALLVTDDALVIVERVVVVVLRHDLHANLLLLPGRRRRGLLRLLEPLLSDAQSLLELSPGALVLGRLLGLCLVFLGLGEACGDGVLRG
mmetsp:Transcript_4065/g.15080  ORF Transcript_4065/g.15080 Transcript_4065/m.15080 type:complete len:391 (-) Transcript_4065:235-1407(-)